MIHFTTMRYRCCLWTNRTAVIATAFVAIMLSVRMAATSVAVATASAAPATLRMLLVLIRASATATATAAAMMLLRAWRTTRWSWRQRHFCCNHTHRWEGRRQYADIPVALLECSEDFCKTGRKRHGTRAADNLNLHAVGCAWLVFNAHISRVHCIVRGPSNFILVAASVCAATREQGVTHLLERMRPCSIAHSNAKRLSFLQAPLCTVKYGIVACGAAEERLHDRDSVLQ